MNGESLAPGFIVVHGNRPELLRDLMLAWMTRYPLAPLEDEIILVQSNGIAQWLKMSLARDVAAGGCGVAAALQTQLPSRFIWQAYRSVLGASAVPPASPFDKSQLVWRLMRILPALLLEDVFAPLRRFLEQDDDLRKRHQLADRLADLFDQYQVYRADWLSGWAAGEDTIACSRGGVQPVPSSLLWQPRLWRALLADVGPAVSAGGRADVHRRFLAAANATTEARPSQLPRRLVVFGISSMPQQSLEVLAALSSWTQVLMCVHNPCEHDWSHIVADKDLLRAQRLRQRRRPGGEGTIGDESLHLHAHPLLAAWGKQGRDFIRLLDVHDERQTYEQRVAALGHRIDCFEATDGATLLQQLQDDIRDLRPLAETRDRWPGVDVRADRSIRFHVTHGPQREVEVLHDQLLAALAADPSLRPRDVIVMVPDIATYAPHVQAVFGLRGNDDARQIPFSVADQGQRHHDPLLGALEQLLGLPQSRIAASDVLDLLEVPALRARFGIPDDQIQLLHRWISGARIRWGLHAEQRARLNLPGDLSQNTWTFGLRRMLLGYAVGAGQGWQGIEPLDEIGGLDAALLGRLVRLVDALESNWRRLSEPATPAVWRERLHGLLQDFFSAEGSSDGLTLMRLETSLQDWEQACADAGLDEPLPLSVVREHWLAQMDQAGLGQPFFAGGVTFATLMPMRAIPFRWIALLGMNDGDYPRSRMPMDFDLMGQDYRPSDRSRREDDRYLFLEALLSARDHLHVSWVSRSIRDNEERPASVLVSQLRDHLAAGWRLRGDERAQQLAGPALLKQLTVEHRLQPFHPAYFDGQDERLFSYAREWRRGAGAGPPRDKAQAVLPSMPRDGALTLRRLADFLKDPVRCFFGWRLGIHFESEDPVGEDHEPFAVDALERWKLQDELIKAQKAALAESSSLEAALASQLARIAGRGELPAGWFCQSVQDQLAEPMADLFSRYEKASREWPTPVRDVPLDHLPEGADPSLRLEDWLDHLRDRQDGQRGRLLLESSGLVKDGKYRRDKLLPYWVAHLAAHVCGMGLTTVIVSKVGTVTLPPLTHSIAEQSWSALLQAWQRGLNEPLPLAPGCAFVWMEKGGQSGDSAETDAWQAARSRYEDSDPDRGRIGERDRNPYLARAFPDFEALWADGEFARLADTLLRPLMDVLGDPPKPPKAKAGDAE